MNLVVKKKKKSILSEEVVIWPKTSREEVVSKIGRDHDKVGVSEM